MLFHILALIVGLVVLVWSADKFVSGASNVARFYRVPPLLIGIVIIGFGTSAPELMVSALSSFQGNSGIALGNAYGSNISNIGLILGVTACLSPLTVQSQVIKKEIPFLLAAIGFSSFLLFDLSLSRFDACALLLLFLLLMGWSIYKGLKNDGDTLALDVEKEFKIEGISLRRSSIELVLGFLLLVGSSRVLVFGAVGIAKQFGLSDMLIGLTIIAIGTSLPELASSVMAAKKGESDMALGNVLGSNLFNTLAVVGLSGVIAPMEIQKAVFYRDIGVQVFLTVALLVFGVGIKKEGRITRIEGGLLLLLYVGYTVYILSENQ